jgi:predicted porin
MEKRNMKRTLVALAAMASLGAMAETSMTVYGVIDGGIRQDSNAAKTSTNGTQSLTQFLNGTLNTSRFGFKGTKDLQSGLKANFKLESGFTEGNGQDSGNVVNPAVTTVPQTASTYSKNTLFDRTASAGLQGSWGSLDLGRMTTFAYDLNAGYVTDPLGLEMTNNNPQGLAIQSSFFTVRRDNTFKYMGTFGAVSVGAAYSLANVAGSQSAGSSMQAMAKYAGNGFNLAASTDSLQDGNSLKQTLSTFGGNVTVAGFKITAGGTQLSTPAGFAPVASSFTSNSYSNPAGFIVGGVATAQTKINVANLGVAYQMGLFNIVGGYYNAQIQQGALASNTVNTMIVRVRYALDPSTDLYVEADSSKASGLAESKSAGMSLSDTGMTAGLQYRF